MALQSQGGGARRAHTTAAHAPTRVALPRAARSVPLSPRPSLPFSVRRSVLAAGVPDRALRLARARRQLAERDPSTRGGDGPRRLRATLMRTVHGDVARILSDGLAAAPADAPAAVQQAIWAGNQLIGLPYVYGGGHGSFTSSGYDCSGSVSFALHGGAMLSAPMDSAEFFDWGRAGRGRWVTVYTSSGHAFVEIAGIRLDTSTAGDLNGLSGPRWRPLLDATAGYVARHPAGY
jgi:cell wall-associated NlpC family hydrolase